MANEYKEFDSSMYCTLITQENSKLHLKEKMVGFFNWNKIRHTSCESY